MCGVPNSRLFSLLGADSDGTWDEETRVKRGTENIEIWNLEPTNSGRDRGQIDSEDSVAQAWLRLGSAEIIGKVLFEKAST